MSLHPQICDALDEGGAGVVDTIEDSLGVRKSARIARVPR